MEWKVSQGLVPYAEGLAFMESRVAAIRQGEAEECIWLLEHPPLYTAGTSAKAADLLEARFPVFKAGRGGEYTYHGPGQRIAYVMLDLKRRNLMDLRAYVQLLEQWIIAALAELGVEGFVRQGRIGVWVQESGIRNQESRNLIPDTRYPIPESKIAALGVRVRKWVTYHGVAINVNPDLSHYAGIVPCGIKEFGVTSLSALGVKAGMKELDAALKKTFPCG